MKKRFIYLISAVLAVAGAISCSTTKFVPEGQYLLDRVQIKVDSGRPNSDELSPYLRQTPNFRIFGLLKWPLYLYNWSGKDEKRWINRQLRRIGEAPQVMDTMLVAESVAQFERYLTNKGYMHNRVTAVIDTSRTKKAAVIYHVTPGAPTRIRHYRLAIDDRAIDSIVRQAGPNASRLAHPFNRSDNEYTPLVQPGDRFDRDQLDKERQRLTTLLRRRGYYAFNRDYIHFTADTIAGGPYEADLELSVKPFLRSMPDGAVVAQRHRPYTIGTVRIFADYNPLDSAGQHLSPVDSVMYRNHHIYYGRRGRSIRPGVLGRGSYFKPGQPFSEWDAQQTYSALSAMQALRHVSIRYDERIGADSVPLIDCNIYTGNARLQGVGVDIEGTNSDGDLGFATGLSYQHRNLFKGSELFAAKVRGAYEYLPANRQVDLGNYWELAGEASLTFPTFLFPFTPERFRRKIRATTEFAVSYNQQRRPEYRRAILSGGWNYHWQDRTDSYTRHTFKLVDINYVYLPTIDADFRRLLPDNIALYNYSDQFIVSTGYVYHYNSYDPLQRRRNTTSLRAAVEVAGNTLYAFSKLLGAPTDANGRYRLFGINFSQYAKADVDFARHLIIDDRNSVAFHLGVGIGYPYGNRREMPFERSYFAGGANSNRGWNVRSLGPGSMTIDSATTFINQIGDIRLDVNLEYRSKLFWRFEAAAFVDAGNIWTVRNYAHQPRGRFDLARFYKEIAVSYGLGLRLDFDFFLVRLDAGLKAYNPQQPRPRDRWALLRPNLTHNFAWHFAVGYPF